MRIHADGFEDVFNDFWIVEKSGAEVKLEAITFEDFVSSTYGV